MKNFFYFISILILFGCNDTTKQKKINKSLGNLQKISITLSEMKKVSLSQIYDDVRWVKLETNDKNAIGEIIKLDITSNRIYIHSDNFLDIFTSEGKFIRRISNSGYGPDEYASLSDFFVDEQNKLILIYDSKSKKILKYSDEGKFIDDIEVGLDGYAFTKLDHNNYAIYIGSAYYNKDSNCRLNILNQEGEIKAKYIPIKDNEAKFLHLGDLTNFIKFNGSTSFLYSFNDTIYNINSKGVVPKIHIDFGNDKLPKEYLEETYSDIREFLEMCKKTDFAYRIIGFFETPNAIAFSFMYKYKIIHVYYFKNSKEKYVVNELTNDFNFPSLSIPSSFDNLPKASFGNDFYTIQSAYDFVEKIKSIKNKLSGSEWNLYKEKNPEIISLYNSTDIYDNPLLMIGKTKKE